MNYQRRKRDQFYGRKNRTRTSANLKTDGLGEESQRNHKLVENRTRRPKERKNIRHRYKRQECIEEKSNRMGSHSREIAEKTRKKVSRLKSENTSTLKNM